MKRTLFLYALAMALGAFVLQWLEFKYAVRVFSTEIYIALIAVAFAGLGVWAGHRLTARKDTGEFSRNAEAATYLGISERELEVLDLLAEGHTNKEIATRLHVSPNTVKTHLAHLYGKLEVSRRTQAIRKARSLRLIP